MRTCNFNLNQWAGWNFGGDRLYSGGNVNIALDLDQLLQRRLRASTSTPRRSGIAPRAAAPACSATPARASGITSNTDNRKPLSFYYNGNHWGDSFGSVRPRLQPRRQLARDLVDVAQPGIRYDINHDDAQWVENVEELSGATRYVFGRIDQTTVAITTRFNYTMTPNLSLQVYAEPFVSAGDYSNFKELVDGRAPGYGDRYRPYAYASNPDFNYRSFRTTNVLRWEYKPGSALFVVWQQGKSDEPRDTATSASAGTSAACSRLLRTTCSWSSSRTG